MVWIVFLWGLFISLVSPAFSGVCIHPSPSCPGEDHEAEGIVGPRGTDVKVSHTHHSDLQLGSSAAVRMRAAGRAAARGRVACATVTIMVIVSRAFDQCLQISVKGG